MPWCPICKAEYREEVKVCSDCNAELVNKLEEENYDEEAFLISVSGDIEANAVEALLRAYEIPIFRRYREAGGYLEIYMGMSTAGVDLFVPSRCLEDAKEIIKNETEKKIVENDDLSSFEEAYQKKRRIRTWIILTFFMPGIIWIIFIVIFNLIKMLKI
ncbi:hypothetical protein [Abyssisolibacter fermentans]|uniref:hypothetical protein n=1 Tax=Abyssisolibacter fermentans TaxID=1766203 RepID=UPI00083783AB|nr:hypothetical protein [Abyssisolibacter fermentans]